MITHRFSTGSKFLWDNITYEVKRVLPNDQVNIEALLTDHVRTVPTRELVQALFSGNLYFAIKESSSKSELPIQYAYPTLDDCPVHLQNTARYRLWVITPLLEMGKKRTREAVNKRVDEVRETLAKGTVPFPTAKDDKAHGARTSISITTIYDWMRSFEESGGDVRALIPNSDKQGGRGRFYGQEATQAITKAVIEELYMRREKYTIDDVHAEIALRLDEENRLNSEETLKPPSRRTVARRIERLDMQEKFAARHGDRVAKHKFSQFDRTPYPDKPLARVEIDHTKLDIIVVDEGDNIPLGRPTLTTCLDTATRYPLGYYLGFEPPSYLTVMECLYHAIRPKENLKTRYGLEHDWLTYGLPTTLVIDNGKEFVGRDLEDACLQLGIILQQTPVRMPHFKSTIERYFGSLNTGLFHTLPGTTFSNTMQRGDYNSLKFAKLTLPNLDRIIHIFLIDYYAERFHKGLQGVPARRWEDFMNNGFIPRLPSSAEELEILLGRVKHRKVEPYGIELFSLRYNCSELISLRTRGEKVKIKYHPGDLSCIYVYDPTHNYYIEVPSLAPDYTEGLSLWKHKVIRAFVLREQEKVDILALAQAKRKIQEIVNEAKPRSKVSTRSKMARWQSSGKPARQMLGEAGDKQSKNIPQKEPEQAIPAPPLPPLDLTFDPADLEKQGWGVTYNATSLKNDKELADNGTT